MIGCFNKSVITTYLGIIFAITGMTLLFTMTPNNQAQLTDFAVICLICAGICDLFDGMIARKCKREEIQKQFGIQIDSLADIICTVLYPAVLLYFLSTPPIYVFIPLASFYVICGVTRLAWFNIHVEDFRGYFKGVPVTYISIIVPIIYALLYAHKNIFDIVLPITYVIIGLLYVLDIKIPKPKGVWYLIFPVLAIIFTIIILI